MAAPAVVTTANAAMGLFYDRALADRTGLPPVAVKTFLAYGMLLNTAAACG